MANAQILLDDNIQYNNQSVSAKGHFGGDSTLITRDHMIQEVPILGHKVVTQHQSVNPPE